MFSVFFMEFISLQLGEFPQAFPSLPRWEDSFSLLATLPKGTEIPAIGPHTLLCKCHGFWKEVYSSVLLLFTACKSIFMFTKKTFAIMFFASSPQSL